VTDVAHELAGQVLDRGEDPAGNHIALDLGKPVLDLVEPGGVGRSVVEMYFGVSREEFQSEKRQFRMFYANARQNRPLRQGGKPFGLKTELELRVCKLNGPSASLNQDLKRKFRLI
jgi:hypothetical protein